MIQLFKPLMSFLSFLIPEHLQGTEMAGTEQNIFPKQKTRSGPEWVAMESEKPSEGSSQGCNPHASTAPNTPMCKHSLQAWALPSPGPEQGLLEGKIKPVRVRRLGCVTLGGCFLEFQFSHLKNEDGNDLLVIRYTDKITSAVREIQGVVGQPRG